jgi:hypothetical protein
MVLSTPLLNKLKKRLEAEGMACLRKKKIIIIIDISWASMLDKGEKNNNNNNNNNKCWTVLV